MAVGFGFNPTMNVGLEISSFGHDQLLMWNFSWEKNYFYGNWFTRTPASEKLFFVAPRILLFRLISHYCRKDLSEITCE